MLQINNLKSSIEGKEILKGINLKLEQGKVYAIMGPNGSGKSTLANILMGNPKYKINEGEIIFQEENISNMKADERAKLGMFLSFQYPQEISGVTISNFLRTAYNALKEKKISFLEFRKLLKEKAEQLRVNEDFLARYLNEGFSGGEKKKSEILQLLVLNPKLAILDETDSGLDIDALKSVAQGIKNFASPDKTIIIITHYKRILDYLNIDKVFIMKDGLIIKEGDKSLVDEIENEGYELIK
ncbi:MAG: Fe-S cluster assembly ATPase SufC [Nanoarchaeota archaeon]|nr:Fe-S cluster assembly ATPase SufC [Nanoarchaeota archaeon]